MLGLLIGVALALNEPAWVAECAKGDALYEQGRLAEAISMLELARQHADKSPASDLASTKILDVLGASYEQAGRLREAQEAFDRSLAIRRARLKSPNDAIAISLTNEASLSWAMVKPDEALAYASQATAMWEQLGQTDRREYLIALNNLLTAELLRDDLRQLQPLVKKARELYARNLARTDPMLPLSLCVVAAVLKGIGEYREATDVAEDALQSAEAQNAPAATIAKVKGGLGDILCMQGRLAEAERMLGESVAVPVGESALDVVDRASTYRSLGTVERLMGKYDQANAVDLHALRLLERAHGQADLVRGEVLNELGVVAENQSKWKDAEDYLNKAVGTLEAAFGPGHPSISPVYSDLASLYMQRHRYDKAEARYKRVLATEIATFPAEHPAIARDLNNLASLEFRRRRFEYAEELFEKATQMMQHTLGPAHQDTALVEINLANTLFERKRYPEARDYYERALGTLEHCWGEDDPRLVEVLRPLAVLSRKEGEAAQAENLETRMERIRVKQAIAREREQTVGTS